VLEEQQRSGEAHLETGADHLGTQLGDGAGNVVARAEYRRFNSAACRGRRLEEFGDILLPRDITHHGAAANLVGEHLQRFLPSRRYYHVRPLFGETPGDSRTQVACARGAHHNRGFSIQ